MKQAIMIWAAMLLLAGAVLATEFAGVVVDREDSSPLPGATITIEGGSIVLPADASGRFVLTHENQSLTVSISHVGYKTLHRVTLAAGLAGLRRPVRFQPLAGSVMDSASSLGTGISRAYQSSRGSWKAVAKRSTRSAWLGPGPVSPPSPKAPRLA